MIVRNPAAATGRPFDLVVVGGGIVGVSLLQEAARRGLSACLCEAADFGGATSWNSLRIVHGGLRYLQTLDLRRFFQSVAARRRIATQFPSLVRPTRFLMPLYGRGLKRVSVLRTALLANDMLSRQRNAGLDAGAWLPGGGVLDAAAVRRLFPQVRTEGLEGAAYWSDYSMVSSERILIELLHDACGHGAVALNYAPVDGLVSEGGTIRGVRGRDLLTGAPLGIAGRAVVNCAGPRVLDLVRGDGGEVERLFAPSLAFNLLLDVDLQVDCALAVSAPDPRAPLLFLVPQPGAVLAGTMHLPRPAGTIDATPTEAEIAGLIGLLNQAIPSLAASPDRVSRVFAGLLPAAAPGTARLRTREIVTRHTRPRGLRGLYSASGVKFSTASDVARQVLEMIPGAGGPMSEASALPLSAATPLVTRRPPLPLTGSPAIDGILRALVEQEAVFAAEDLLLRRTNWGLTEPRLQGLAAGLGQALGLPAGGVT